MQSTPSQYGVEDNFEHLEGASGYSFKGEGLGGLNDDTSSIHSSSTTTTNNNNNLYTLPPHQQALEYGGGVDREDLEVLDFDQLSLGNSHPHSHSHSQLQSRDGQEEQVANLYEEDFEGMLEDLNRELPPHACS